ncbi:MAG TPA: M23 family metallopeptidase [Gaiellaceae bacterium]|nr:M23 family metallopeptidase [Gaiellaceae bacterium]
MSRHRTTARSLLAAALLAGLVVGTAGAHTGKPVAKRAVPQLIFPVAGGATYVDDFGDPRGQGGHQGNDLMAPKRSPAVAAEAGTVKFWTTSARAGCMLYLHGQSGTTYLYIHLNNDRTLGNDNRGGCKPGVSFAKGLKSGAKVEAGQIVGYVGDSGDADGIASHLHFEVHPGGGAAVSPFPHLRKAKRLLFAAEPGAPFTLALNGTVVQANDGSLELDVASLRRYPGGLRVPKVGRRVELAVPPHVVVLNPLGALLAAAKLAAAKPGQAAQVWTEKAETTLEAQLGAPLVLSAQRILLKQS